MSSTDALLSNMMAKGSVVALPKQRQGAVVRMSTMLLAVAFICLIALAGCGAQGEEAQNPAEIVETNQEGQDAGEEQGQMTGVELADNADEAQTEDAAQTEEQASDATGLLVGTVVCIDAGHGSISSTDPSPNNPDSDVSESIYTQPLGASGDESGNEYDVNLAVAKYLQADLEAAGATVVMVRTTNDVVISPKERAEIANDADADIFIRLHCDGAGSSAHGFLTLIPDDTGYQADNDLYKVSQAMGKQMHESIVEELGANDRGTVVRSDQGGFNWCKVPCVLFEMGNMDNAKDDALLADDSYLQKMANAICNATVQYVAG